MRQVWWSAGKREGFGRRRGENEIEKKKRLGSCCSEN